MDFNLIMSLFNQLYKIELKILIILLEYMVVKAYFLFILKMVILLLGYYFQMQTNLSFQYVLSLLTFIYTISKYLKDPHQIFMTMDNLQSNFLFKNRFQVILIIIYHEYAINLIHFNLYLINQNM